MLERAHTQLLLSCCHVNMIPIQQNDLVLISDSSILGINEADEAHRSLVVGFFFRLNKDSTL